LQQVIDGAPQFGEAGSYGLLTIISNGLGSEAISACPRCCCASWASGKLRAEKVPPDRHDLGRHRPGRRRPHRYRRAHRFPGGADNDGAAENIFIVISTTLMHPLFAGVMMSGYSGRHDELGRLLSAHRRYCFCAQHL
jgi:hypothetical protein